MGLREDRADAGDYAVWGFSRRAPGAAASRKNGSRETLIEDAAKIKRLRINEIFHSLQGEADCVGIPTVFVRLTGCPLRCQYCDTTYAFHGGAWVTFQDILRKVRDFDTHHVCVTGGEPLAQKGCLVLLRQLCDAGLRVSLETSGAMSLAGVDPRVVLVVDVKTPGSGEEARNRYQELQQLQPKDLVKFVICNREDYEWSRAKLEQLQL